MAHIAVIYEEVPGWSRPTGTHRKRPPPPAYQWSLVNV